MAIIIYIGYANSGAKPIYISALGLKGGHDFMSIVSVFHLFTKMDVFALDYTLKPTTAIYTGR